MDPGGFIQGVGWLVVVWIAVALVASVGLSAFFKAARGLEQRLPEDEAGIRAWVRRVATRRSRAA